MRFLRLIGTCLNDCRSHRFSPKHFAFKSSVLSPVLTQSSHPPLFNIGCGEDLSVRELAEMIAETVSYSGKLVFDSTKPDGAMRKLMDVSKIQGLGWKASKNLKEGINLTYKAYIEVQS